MAKAVVGLYRTADKAQEVVSALVSKGCRREDIGLMAKGDQTVTEGETEETGSKAGQGLATGAGIGAALGGLGGVLVGLGAIAIPGVGPIIAAGPIAAGLMGAAGGAVAGGLVGGLIVLGIPEHEAHQYAEGVRRGGTLVTVRTEDDRADNVSDIMDDYDPIDIHTEAERWRSQGWTGRSDWSASDRGDTISLAEEQLVVGKRAVDSGGKRIRTRVVETPVEETVQLHQERVDVERMPVDRPVSNADAAFRERSVEMRETDEEAVVGKTARVTEEVRLHKEGEDREERIHETLRKTEVDVENVPGSTKRPPEGRPSR